MTKELATQYTAYDVDQANEHLDRAGYTDRDDDGFRLGPNGQRISFAVDVPTPVALFPFWPDAMELVQGYWQDVGIDAQVSVISRDRYAQRANANEHEATIGWGDGGLLDAILDPRFYFPTRAGDSKYAVAWANWYTGGDPQEEPPEAPRRQMELYERLKTVLDEGQRNDLFRQIRQIAKEEFYCIGIALPQGDYGIVKNNFHNVPDPMVLSWMYPTPGPTHPEQYFVAAE